MRAYSLLKTMQAILCMGLATLAGCASQVTVLPTLSPETRLKANQGIVVARLINAGDYPFPFGELIITPENLNASEEIKPKGLEGVINWASGSAAFATPVKAGHYTVRGRSFGGGTKLGTFDVKAGRITDLGSLIYYPKPDGDKYIRTLLRAPDSVPGQVLEHYFDFYEPTQEPVLSWNDDGYDEDRYLEYVAAARNPVSFQEEYLAPDGSIYLLGRLGVILKRSSRGEWTLDAVDTNLDLRAIAQNNKGDLIVGGKEGRIFWKPAKGEWQDLSIGHNYDVEELVFRDERTVDALAHKKTELVVFRARTEASDASWEPLSYYSSLTGWRSPGEPAVEKPGGRQARPRIIDYARLLRTGDDHFVIVGTRADGSNVFSKVLDRRIFPYHPEDWQVESEEGDPEFLKVVNGGTVELRMTEPGLLSVDRSLVYSKYNEKTGNWEEIASHLQYCRAGVLTRENRCRAGRHRIASRKIDFRFTSAPWFRDSLNGVAIGTFEQRGRKSGAGTYVTRMLVTYDGGNSWRESENQLPNEYCTSIVSGLADRLLLSCEGATSDFYESDDNGRTWEQVRQHENF